MKKIVIRSFILILILFFTPNLLAQAKTIEERLADLEKRVQALEAKLGTTQTIGKPQTPKTTEKITDDIIYATIKEKLKKEVPPTWAGSLMGVRNAVIEKIDIQQIGNYSEQGKYWPVKCRVKGHAMLIYFLKQKRMRLIRLAISKYGRMITAIGMQN